MRKQRHEATKNAVGLIVLEKFESVVLAPSFDAKANVKRIEEASKLVEEMPYVSLPLREHGVIGQDEGNTAYIHLFQPNIWVQDVAHGLGKLGSMTIESAVERADATIEYKIETSLHLKRLMASGKFSEQAVRKAMQEASMIESIMYERLGGTAMPERVNHRVDIACMKRLAKDSHIIKEAINAAGITKDDTLGLLQIAHEFGVVNVLQEMVENDPYFKRRTRQLTEFSEINSKRSLDLEVAKTEAFAARIFESIAKRYPGMITDKLRERVAKISGF